VKSRLYNGLIKLALIPGILAIVVITMIVAIPFGSSLRPSLRIVEWMYPGIDAPDCWAMAIQYEVYALAILAIATFGLVAMALFCANRKRVECRQC
jgi:hypothetical protein